MIKACIEKVFSNEKYKSGKNELDLDEGLFIKELNSSFKSVKQDEELHVKFTEVFYSKPTKKQTVTSKKKK